MADIISFRTNNKEYIINAANNSGKTLSVFLDDIVHYGLLNNASIKLTPEERKDIIRGKEEHDIADKLRHENYCLFWAKNLRKTMKEWLNDGGPEDYKAMLERLKGELKRLLSYDKKYHKIHAELKEGIEYMISHPDNFHEKLLRYYKESAGLKYFSMRKVIDLFRPGLPEVNYNKFDGVIDMEHDKIEGGKKT